MATLRSTMSELITELRSLTDTGAEEYSIGDIQYWSNTQLQGVLDNHRTDVKWEEMTAIEEGDGSYLDYAIGMGYFEQTTGGTAIFIVQDLNGATVTSPTYTVDYIRGVVTFASDTTGTAYYVTGRSYDMDGAAAELWRKKMNHYASAVDFSTKVHDISRSQLFDHAKEMVNHFELRGNSGFGTVYVSRSDTDE